ncbi:MAG: hypothetical protein GXP32_00840 [Kiritimatiellaeota bacterium]|nr:hypothetical protein [Kiritimatiellota bacterium]
MPLLIALSMFCFCLTSAAGVLLPGFFSDDMVLQRGVELKIFGDGTPGEQVAVAFNGRKQAVWPDEKSGEWIVKDPIR